MHSFFRAEIPGLFKLNGLSDNGRVIIAAMKFNSKVVAVGMVYNYREAPEINPSTGFAFNPPGLYTTPATSCCSKSKLPDHAIKSPVLPGFF